MATPSSIGRFSVTTSEPVRRADALEEWAKTALSQMADTAEGAGLDQLIIWLTTSLHQQAAHLSGERLSDSFRLIAYFHERREVAELAANPARCEGVKRAAKTFARKVVVGEEVRRPESQKR